MVDVGDAFFYFYFFIFFFIVNSVILPNNKTMLDPIARKLILKVSNRK